MYMNILIFIYVCRVTWIRRLDFSFLSSFLVTIIHESTINGIRIWALLSERVFTTCSMRASRWMVVIAGTSTKDPLSEFPIHEQQGVFQTQALSMTHPTDHVMIGTQKKSFQKGHLLFLIDFGILGWVSHSKTISFRGSRLLNQLDERPKSHVGSPTLTLTNEETQDFANWDVNQDNKTKAGGFIHFPKVFMEWWPQLAHFFGSGFPTVCMIIWMARAQGLLPPWFWSRPNRLRSEKSNPWEMEGPVWNRRWETGNVIMFSLAFINI